MSWAGGLLTHDLFAKDAIARDAGPGGLPLAPTHPVSWLQRRTAQQVEVRTGGGDRIRLVHNQLQPKIERLFAGRESMLRRRSAFTSDGE